MKTILKSTIAAALLVGASMSAASAQDYTWTLNHFHFDYNWGLNVNNQPVQGAQEPPTAIATGSFTFQKVGVNYQLTAYTLNTTVGASIGPSSYGSPNVGLTDGGDSYLEAESLLGGDYSFHFQWDPGSLFALMDINDTSTPYELPGGSSFEEDLLTGNRRYNGSAVCTESGVPVIEGGRCPGFLTLAITNIPEIPVRTPEPASLAVLGAGLLGLFAARRRRA